MMQMGLCRDATGYLASRWRFVLGVLILNGLFQLPEALGAESDLLHVVVFAASVYLYAGFTTLAARELLPPGGAWPVLADLGRQCPSILVVSGKLALMLLALFTVAQGVVLGLSGVTDKAGDLVGDVFAFAFLVLFVYFMAHAPFQALFAAFADALKSVVRLPLLTALGLCISALYEVAASFPETTAGSLGAWGLGLLLDALTLFFLLCVVLFRARAGRST